MANESSFPRPRHSACADAALRAEIERISRMSVRERIIEALSLASDRPKPVKESRPTNHERK